MASPPLPPPSNSPPSTTPKIPIKTTLPKLPFPPNQSRPSLTTPRLTIRPLRPSDLQSLHEIRSQPEVMITNPQGRPDRDITSETKPALDRFLSPADLTKFYFAICLRDSRDEDGGERGGDGGELEEKMIGIGGCHKIASMFGWPVVGYMIRREYWGRGLATEFLVAWLGLWRGLPREEVVVEVDCRSVSSVGLGGGDEGEENERGNGAGDVVKEVPVVPEQIVTWAVSGNIGSWRVMEKAGFAYLMTWTEADLRDLAVDVELKAYRYFV